MGQMEMMRTKRRTPPLSHQVGSVSTFAGDARSLSAPFPVAQLAWRLSCTRATGMVISSRQSPRHPIHRMPFGATATLEEDRFVVVAFLKCT